MADDLASFFKTHVADADAVINRLRDEVADLKRVLAARPAVAGVGLFTIAMPLDVTAARYDRLMALWREQWELLGQAAPALFPVMDGMAIEKLYPDGYGLHVIRVPDDLPMKAASRLATVWDRAWQGTDAPKVPMVVIARSLDLTRLSAQVLQGMGLMRIPDALSGPG
jgi:hypothetical protein